MAQKINSSMFCSSHGNTHHNNSFLIVSLLTVHTGGYKYGTFLLTQSNDYCIIYLKITLMQVSVYLCLNVYNG